jgi:hypothetical protein
VKQWVSTIAIALVGMFGIPLGLLLISTTLGNGWGLLALLAVVGWAGYQIGQVKADKTKDAGPAD